MNMSIKIPAVLHTLLTSKLYMKHTSTVKLKKYVKHSKKVKIVYCNPRSLQVLEEKLHEPLKNALPAEVFIKLGNSSCNE